LQGRAPTEPLRTHADAEQRAENRQNTKLGEKPAQKLQVENQAVEIISGLVCPIRSARHPEPVAPSSRNHKVKVKTAATGTLIPCAIGSMMKTKIVELSKSNAHPSHAAVQACH
jgi:hypothetical protein